MSKNNNKTDWLKVTGKLPGMYQMKCFEYTVLQFEEVFITHIKNIQLERYLQELSQHTFYYLLMSSSLLHRLSNLSHYDFLKWFYAYKWNCYFKTWRCTNITTWLNRQYKPRMRLGCRELKSSLLVLFTHTYSCWVSQVILIFDLKCLVDFFFCYVLKWWIHPLLMSNESVPSMISTSAIIKTLTWIVPYVTLCSYHLIVHDIKIMEHIVNGKSKKDKGHSRIGGHLCKSDS